MNAASPTLRRSPRTNGESVGLQVLAIGLPVASMMPIPSLDDGSRCCWYEYLRSIKSIAGQASLLCAQFALVIPDGGISKPIQDELARSPRTVKRTGKPGMLRVACEQRNGQEEAEGRRPSPSDAASRFPISPPPQHSRHHPNLARMRTAQLGRFYSCSFSSCTQLVAINASGVPWFAAGMHLRPADPRPCRPMPFKRYRK